MKLIRWALHEAWEKINFAGTYREVKALGQKHGRRFFWVALIWEMIEDIVFPFIAWMCGVPGLIPVFLIMHFEPIVYPVFFWAFRMWDRSQGREPWEPDRTAMSAYWRSVVKVTVYQLATLGWLSHIIPWKPLSIFAVLIGLFGFVHERIWHDSNFGIRPDDTVQFRRVLGKTTTYLIISAMVLYPFLKVFEVPILQALAEAQLVSAVFYLALETVWAKSMWGILKVEPHPRCSVPRRPFSKLPLPTWPPWARSTGFARSDHPLPHRSWLGGGTLWPMMSIRKAGTRRAQRSMPSAHNARPPLPPCPR